MIDEERITELTKAEVFEIQQQVSSKLGECKKTYDVIGNQVFSILGLYARVIYYPIGENSPWGLTRMSGSESGESKNKPYVAINSSIPKDEQVFAAAHELYHIWYDGMAEMIPANLLDDDYLDRKEIKANRFAAEFLVDATLLRQEINLHHIERIDVENILKLSAIFSVPYKAMVKRLFEIEAIDKKARERFLKETDENIMKYRKRFSLPVPNADNRTAIDNLVDLSVTQYEAHHITYEKLEYLLQLCNLTPADVGIVSPADFVFPSDEELDSIMEE